MHCWAFVLENEDELTCIRNCKLHGALFNLLHPLNTFRIILLLVVCVFVCISVVPFVHSVMSAITET